MKWDPIIVLIYISLLTTGIKHLFSCLLGICISSLKNSLSKLFCSFLIGGLVSKLCLTLAIPRTVAHQAPLSMGFPDKTTGMDCHFLLQGIFPTQELNLGCLHCRQIRYQLSYEGTPF